MTSPVWPLVGAKIRSRKTGRVYVAEESRVHFLYRLRPLGDDVAPARSEKTGQWQGGVRAPSIPQWRLAGILDVEGSVPDRTYEAVT